MKKDTFPKVRLQILLSLDKAQFIKEECTKRGVSAGQYIEIMCETMKRVLNSMEKSKAETYKQVREEQINENWREKYDLKYTK